MTDVKPVYPPESLRIGDEGVILIELNITADGAVGETKVIWSGCARLDQAALTAVRQWRYEQVLINGKPMPFVVLARVPFRLPKPIKPRAGACKWTDPQRRLQL